MSNDVALERDYFILNKDGITVNHTIQGCMTTASIMIEGSSRFEDLRMIKD